MNEPTGLGLVSVVTFLPLLGAIALMLLPKEFPNTHRYGALLVSILTFGVSMVLYQRFDATTYHFQMTEFVPWIPQFGIHYRVGVDGLSIWLVMLTTFLSIISIWFSFYVSNRVKEYMVLLLVLETAMLGVFVSMDMILFYTFFEASLIPMYFPIAIWGGERRSYAANKFFIYTFAGSIFMLIGMIWMSGQYAGITGERSFAIADIQNLVAGGTFWSTAMHLQPLLFWAFTLAFLIKTPAFPFHTWLPDAHVEAPTAGSVILAGVLLKMGTYGFLRFVLPFFPDAVQKEAGKVVALAVIGILYGAIVAAMQTDVKKLIAYSSVAHMGFVLFGIFTLNHTGLVGASYQQLAHGISTGALFLMVGLLYERTHTRKFSDYGGLKAQMPVYSALFLIVMLSSVGLPGTNGFIGEFMALLGGFDTAAKGLYGIPFAYVVLAGAGVIFAAVYLLWMFQKVFYGPITNPDLKRLKDLKRWEVAMCGLLIVFVFWGGLYPNTFLKPMEPSIAAIRMMALNPEGDRPSWTNLETEIDNKGNLVQVTPRERAGDAWETVNVVVPANFYPESESEEPIIPKLTGEGAEPH
ncbi:MAG: NADH-quinone oxidoreductase subunit M [Nitrospirae bacterium]|nr:NADH-quinone oxidoreductase subunit M [Fimbriimonadaceae bacterium]